MSALREKVIFEYSRPGRGSRDQWPEEIAHTSRIPEHLRRRAAPRLPEVSELDAVRHFTRLSQLNFSIDTHFYPLGSCTMKYNPKACNAAAMLPGFLGRHPLAPGQARPGLPPLYVRAAGDAQGDHRDARGRTQSARRRARRVRWRRNDSR